MLLHKVTSKFSKGWLEARLHPWQRRKSLLPAPLFHDTLSLHLKPLHEIGRSLKAYTGLLSWTGSPYSPMSTTAKTPEGIQHLRKKRTPHSLALTGDEHLNLSSNCSLNSGSSKSHKTVMKFSIVYHHLSDQRKEF